METKRVNTTESRFAATIVRWRNVLLAIAAVLAALSLYPANQLEMDRRIEEMFSPSDPAVAGYHLLKQRFGGNEIVLAVYRDETFWQPKSGGMQRLTEISENLGKVPGVQAVLSLAQLNRVLEKLSGPGWLRGDQAKTPPILANDNALAASLRELFEGYTHKSGQPWIAVACMLEPIGSERATASQRSSDIAAASANVTNKTISDDSISAALLADKNNIAGQIATVPREVTVDAIRDIMSNLKSPLEPGYITGEPVMVIDGFRLVEQDGWRLGTSTTVLLAIVALLAFRSLRWAVIPLLVVHWSLLVTKSILVISGLQLSMVSSMLTAIVTVIGVATVIHLILEYRQERNIGLSPRDAMTAAMSRLMVPIFWACMTDAVGFAALMIAQVGPVQDFGLMMAIGSIVVFFGVVLIVPGAALLGSIDADPQTMPGDRWLRGKLVNAFDFVLRHRRIGVCGVAILAIWAIWSASRIEVETDFTKNFRANSPLVEAYAIVEQHLGGAGVWDVLLPAPAVLTDGYLQEVRQLEQQLRELRIEGSSAHLTKVLSVADADQAAKASPLLAWMPAAARVEGMRQAMPEFTAALLTPVNSENLDSATELAAPKSSANATKTTRRWLRVMLRSPEQTDADAKLAMIREVSETVENFVQRPEWKAVFPGASSTDAVPKSEGESENAVTAASVTGYHVLLARMIDSVLMDQWKCFGLAMVLIGTMMSIAVRSVPMAAAAMLTNALPVLVVQAVFSSTGQRINLGAAMIAAVSLGLSIDSSIHYLASARRAYQGGKSWNDALKDAQSTVGVALILATASLIAGFSTLSISQFIPTVVFGTLVSLTMAGGLLGNLLLLPMLLAEKEKSPPA